MVSKLLKSRALMALVGVLFFVACTTKPEVYWERLEIKTNEKGVNADITYPYIFGGVDSVSDKINDTIRCFYTSWIANADRSCSIDSCLTLLREEKQADSIIAHIEYQILGNGDFFVKGDTVSVWCEKQYYMGGANFMIDNVYLNFNSNTGELIPNKSLVKDSVKVKTLISKYLKENYLPVDGYSCFFSDFDVDSPQLPEMIGLDSTGYVFIYNVYEIAPRSTGVIKFNVPFSGL